MTPQSWPAPLAYEPVHAIVRVPGSKSETNRALILAALSDAPSTITGALDARDTRLMRAALRALGVGIDDNGDAWRVEPAARLGGSRVGIDCGLAGTVMRFVPPLAALGEQPVRFDGDEQAHARPMGPLLDALYDMGARIDPDTAQSLPFTLTGQPRLAGGPVNIDASASSQFVSGLLMCGARYVRGLDLRHHGAPVPSRPHIDMTIAMLRERGVHIDTEESDSGEPNRWVVSPGPIEAKDQVIAPDLSNAAAFLAAAVITGGNVTIPDWPADTTQPGRQFADIARAFGALVEYGSAGITVTGQDVVNGIDVDLSAASELTPVVAAIAAVGHSATHLRGIGHIRGHETDRLAALESELNNLGSHTVQTDDGLTIHPRVLHGGTWRTYADHRMAQAGALLGLLVPDVVVDDIGCTAKTMPQFVELWADMQAQSRAWSESRM